MLGATRPLKVLILHYCSLNKFFLCVYDQNKYYFISSIFDVLSLIILYKNGLTYIE